MKDYLYLLVLGPLFAILAMSLLSTELLAQGYAWSNISWGNAALSELAIVLVAVTAWQSKMGSSKKK